MESSTRVGRFSQLRITCSVPREQAIASGTPAFCATLKEPAWKGSSSPVLLRVPSG